jgi:hypothetical protein
MAAAPKRRRLRAALQERAEQELGENATILDYVDPPIPCQLQRWLGNTGYGTERSATLAQTE